jgi:hypothetical protein
MKGHDTVHAELSKGLAFYYADSNNQVSIRIKNLIRFAEFSNFNSTRKQYN